jgi:hypothetical protein
VRDFYASSAAAPLDQADGLRRLFSGRAPQLLALVANPHVAFAGLLLDRVAQALAASGRKVLVADAGPGAPEPHELWRMDLAAGVERVADGVKYLPARGLPRAHVDTCGLAHGFLDALERAAPGADVLLVHAEAADLARMLGRRALRPVLVGADHPESIKHAYASAKLLMQRTGLATFDLLLAAGAHSPRVQHIATSLASCAESFLGALLCQWALVDPAAEPQDTEIALRRLLAAQLAGPPDAPLTAPLRSPASAPAPARR